TVCVVGKMRDLILQLSKSSIYSTKPLVYSKKQFIGDTEITVHLCPQCFGKKVISVLQPMEIMRFDAHFRTFCPACNNKFWMNSR
ncbi:hypothetical protein P2R98_24765, partial [Escherichia coli]